MSLLPTPPAQRTAQTERERQIIDLRLKSPKRSLHPQHDASDLALFRSANEPGLL